MKSPRIGIQAPETVYIVDVVHHAGGIWRIMTGPWAKNRVQD
jgi:hypothetical protein